MIERLQHFINTLQTNWSGDPAARGAAKMTAGAILVAEGLFGAIRNVGSKSTGGLLGGIIGVVFGIVFMVVGSWVAPSYEDVAVVEGRIVDVEQSSTDGKTMYAAVYEYSAAGTEYRFTSGITSSSRPTIGDTVEIGYSLADPRNAHRADGIDGKFHMIFYGVGALIVLLSAFSLLLSIALIAFGIYLFKSGRLDRMSAGKSEGFLKDLISLAQDVRAGRVDISKTAPGQAGYAQGDATLHGTGSP